MKRIIVLALVTLPLLAQETFDFKLLDKLGANASNKTNVTLDSDLLKLAGAFLGGAKGGADSIKPLLDGLKGVYVRSFEFDGDGKYNEGDLAPLRAFLKQRSWNKIVDVAEKKETSEIWIQPLPNNRIGGFAIVSAEPREVTVVYIEGVLKMEDIAKLSGNLGIPDLKSMDDVRKLAGEAGKDSDKKKEDER